MFICLHQCQQKLVTANSTEVAPDLFAAASSLCKCDQLPKKKDDENLRGLSNSITRCCAVVKTSADEIWRVSMLFFRFYWEGETT